MRKNLTIFIILLFSWYQFTNGQEKQQEENIQFPLVISFLNHSVTLPFSGIIKSPLHPGFSAGTEYTYKRGRIGEIFQTLNLGYYFNEYNAKALFVHSDLGYRYTT